MTTWGPGRTVRYDGPGWTGLDTCTAPELDSYQCGVLTVPKDRRHPHAGTLDLDVLVAGDLDAGRTLLMLTGGPGQPGPALAPRVLPAFDGIADQYRIVMLDQRGTGAHALDCPDLQEERGGSDLLVPSRAAVRACAETIGDLRLHVHTTDTVADLEDLRRALGVRRWAVDGVSYGSYTGARYAGAHPRHVTQLVLDSPVPVTGFDSTLAETFPDYARVMRLVCATEGRDCPGDPAADLHALLERRPALGPDLLNLVTTIAYIDSDSLLDLPERLHAAAGGDDGPIEEFLALATDVFAAPADEYSQGTQATTLCADLDFPWGGADSPEQIRDRAADRAVARLSKRELFPFNHEAARSNGEMVLCENWPRMPDRPVPSRDLRVRVPTLIVAGDHDLGTPLTWAHRAHRRDPRQPAGDRPWCRALDPGRWGASRGQRAGGAPAAALIPRRPSSSAPRRSSARRAGGSP